MAIPIPTIDQFKDTTVMRCIRKVVDYLIEDVVPAINQSPSQDTKVSAVENSISTDSKLTTIVTNSDGSTATSVPVQLPESGGTELNITQTPDGITINNIALQEATATQDGLVTKEQVKAIADNTAMGDALSKELINGIVLAEGATAGTIKATLEQEDGTTIVSNELALPSSGATIIPFVTYDEFKSMITDLQIGDIIVIRTFNTTSYDYTSVTCFVHNYGNNSIICSATGAYKKSYNNVQPVIDFEFGTGGISAQHLNASTDGDWFIMESKSYELAEISTFTGIIIQSYH